MDLSVVGAAVENVVRQLLPALPVAVPFVVALCSVYLVANDVLDVALVAKAKGLQAVRLVDVRDALVDDVANRNAVASAAVFALTALGVSNGNLRDALVGALVGAAGANVANLESSTFAKVRTLLASRVVALNALLAVEVPGAPVVAQVGATVVVPVPAAPVVAPAPEAAPVVPADPGGVAPAGPPPALDTPPAPDAK